MTGPGRPSGPDLSLPVGAGLPDDAAVLDGAPLGPGPAVGGDAAQPSDVDAVAAPPAQVAAPPSEMDVVAAPPSQAAAPPSQAAAQSSHVAERPSDVGRAVPLPVEVSGDAPRPSAVGGDVRHTSRPVGAGPRAGAEPEGAVTVPFSLPPLPAGPGHPAGRSRRIGRHRGGADAGGSPAEGDRPGRPSPGDPAAGRVAAGRPPTGHPDPGQAAPGEPASGHPWSGHPSVGGSSAAPSSAGRPSAGPPPSGPPPAARSSAGYPSAARLAPSAASPSVGPFTGGAVAADPAADGPVPAGARPARLRTGLVLASAVGALVSVGIGVYGRVHEPAFFAVNVGGFSSGTAAKAWLATLAFLLALVQLGSSLVMYGRIPRITAPSWIGGLHRWSGRVAVLVTVPVAVHCLYALGFQSGEPRVLVHSLFGCFLYGAFVAKMLLLRREDTPGWALPAFGGAVFTALVALWLTSSVWFFTTSGLTF